MSKHFPPGTYPALLGISCDADDVCDNGYEADFRVHEDDDRATRLGYILDHAASRGWTITGRHDPENALAYCPEHSDQWESA